MTVSCQKLNIIVSTNNKNKLLQKYSYVWKTKKWLSISFEQLNYDKDSFLEQFFNIHDILVRQYILGHVRLIKKF